MADRIKKLQYAILFERKKEFSTIVSNYPCSIDQIKLNGDNNLVHYLVYSDRLNMLGTALELFREQHKDRPDHSAILKAWMEARNDKNQTPIHLAVISGNIVS